MGFEVARGPDFVETGRDVPIQGHYVVTFLADDGSTVERFATDKGRARLLRVLDGGRRTFDADEVELLTTPATIDDLLAALDAEGAEGA